MPTIYSKEELGKDRVDGFYETPLLTVEFICSKILPHYSRGKKILDPTVGDGVFLKHLLRAGVSKDDLYGFDIDEQKIAQLKKTFPNVKVFDATNPFGETFDFIVGNPPYNGDESHFVRENRERLQTVAKEVGAKNTFSIISYHAINALNPGGYFSMILSDAFTTNTYYRLFREFVLRSLELDELLLAPWKLFHSRSADVRTCILSGRRKETWKEAFEIHDSKHKVRLVDRLSAEEQYESPPNVEVVFQCDFNKYPNASFVIGVPQKIRDLYVNTKTRLGDVVQGGTGISTGNDRKFLRKAGDVMDDPNWVPYYKNGARQPYWYEPDYCIECDYKKNNKSTKNYMIRNERYFFKDGITCSSVGVRFSAAYLPKGCLFGVNANFFFDDETTLYYTLGLLNSRVAWYFARRVLIRTNNISANYLRQLPYKEPALTEKMRIADVVKGLVEGLRKTPKLDIKPPQSDLDDVFYGIYKIDSKCRREIDDFCDNFYEKL